MKNKEDDMKDRKVELGLISGSSMSEQEIKVKAGHYIYRGYHIERQVCDKRVGWEVYLVWDDKNFLNNIVGPCTFKRLKGAKYFVDKNCILGGRK